MMTCDSRNRKERKEEVTDTVVEALEMAAYVGETYQSSYERGREYLISYKASAKTSHIWKNHSSKHLEEK